jgi:nucleoid DNA-binding protein
MKTLKDLTDQIRTDLGANSPGKKVIFALLELASRTQVAFLIEGHEVRLPVIGSLQPVRHAPRKGRNPRTGESMDVPARTTVKLKIKPALRNALNGK